MKRLELGLSDIERNDKEARRRMRNCIKALLFIALMGAAINYATQVCNF